MVFNKYKHIFILLTLIAFGSAVLTYEYMYYISSKGENSDGATIGSFNKAEKKIITDKTNVFIRDSYILCKKYELGCCKKYKIEDTTRTKLINFTEKELINKYPEIAGWKVDWQENNIILERTLEGLCQEHNNCWHLSIDKTGKKVVVYQGPSAVGWEGGIKLLTEIGINKLPETISQKIIEGSLEYYNWNELVATLDSLDEYNIQ
ncbi:MAG: hypothetical protein PHI90_00020 [Clostridia bacterium]|nr:hypothetical protein [Clostridia bacterium]MDD4047214.1 hypothetical protein [Clostridia bacterium]